MEPFYSLAFSFGLHAELSDKLVDIVGKVPEEIGVMILRLLDPRTLLSAALVSKRWLNLCHADSTLRKRILQQVQQERREHLKPFAFIVERKHRNGHFPLSALNWNNRTNVSSGSNTVRPELSCIWAPVVHHFRCPKAEPKEMSKKRKISNLKSLGKTSMTLIAKRMRI